jgi:hypothetical protein
MVAPKPCAFDPKTGCILTEYVNRSRPLTVEELLLENHALLEQAVSIVRQYHQTPSLQPSISGDSAGASDGIDIVDENIDIVDETLPPPSQLFHSSRASDILFGYDFMDLLVDWKKAEPVFTQAQLLQELLYEVTELFEQTFVACHLSLDPSNFLLLPSDSDSDLPTRLIIVDWEWSGPFAPLCDVGFFAASLTLRGGEENETRNEEIEKLVLSYYLQRQPTELELARMTLWRVWSALRCALRARQKCQRVKSGNAMVEADQHLGRFVELLSRTSMTGTEFDTGHVEIVTSAVKQLHMEETKRRMEEERLRRREKERNNKRNSDSDSD